MKRLLALGMIVTLGSASTVFGGEPLLVSATRLAREVNTTPVTPKSDRPGTKVLGVMSFAKTAGVGEPALAAQQGGGAIATTGMKKRTKALIYAGVAATFVGVAYGIDHKVLDVTPSTLGTRDDDSVKN
jgi:hypothetical protein